MSTQDIDTPVDEALLRGDEAAEDETLIDETDEENGEADANDEQDDAAEDDESADDAANEADEVDDQAEDANAASKKESKDKPGFVPVERFNQVYAELKQLKESATTKEEKVDVPQPVDIRALRKEATEALLDGDTDKYNDIQDKIDGEISRVAEEKAIQRITKNQEEREFNAAVAEMKSKYPILDEKTGNPEAIEMVIKMRDGYYYEGMPLAKALEKAAAKVAPLFATKSVEKDEGDDKKQTDKRTLKAVERGAKANETLPPDEGGVGNRAQTQKEQKEITQEQWEKMTPEERDARLAA